MNKPRTIEGRWWIHGDDKPAHFGTLSFDPEEGLELSVKVPQNRTSDETFLSSVEKSEQSKNVLQVIHGADEGNHPITLFGCGSWKTSAASGLDTYRIGNVSTAILNHHGDCWEESRFRVACVNYTLLSQWMNRPLHLESTTESDLMCLKFKSREVFEYELHPGLRMRVDGTTIRGHSSEELCLGWSHRVWFLFDEARSARKIHDDYASVLLLLFCLLTGERVFIEQLSFYNFDPFVAGQIDPLQESELLRQNSGIADANQETRAEFMIACFDEIAPDFEAILKQWFQCHERLEPVLDLYFAVLSNRATTDQSRFLFLAQALEVYHARSAQFCSAELATETHKTRVKAIVKAAPTEHQDWLKEKLAFSNQKTLAGRLDEILTLHHDEVARLTTKINDFASKVRHTRNYYTHYSEEVRRSGKVAEGLELRRIMFALEDLLQVCLLKELGIQGKPIERIMERNISVEYADSESDSALHQSSENAEQS
jgi:hypothetical protein